MHTFVDAIEEAKRCRKQLARARYSIVTLIYVQQPPELGLSRIARARGALQSHVEHKILATRVILEQRLDELEIKDTNHRRECQECVEEFVSKGYCTATIPLINASIYVIKRRLGTLTENDIHKLNNWNGLINRSWMLFVDMLEK